MMVIVRCVFEEAPLELLFEPPTPPPAAPSPKRKPPRNKIFTPPELSEYIVSVAKA